MAKLAKAPYRHSAAHRAKAAFNRRWWHGGRFASGSVTQIDVGVNLDLTPRVMMTATLL